MKKMVPLILLAALSFQAHASVTCSGKITSIYKWNYSETISVMLDSTNRWIRLPNDSDESMALLAFAADKQVNFHWAVSSITSCWDGWAHNDMLVGWFSVDK